ncbi:MAG: hypothetical protein EXS08_11455 [Planctomycetes bacterium]|nr:hypothetical protein [Planctomycetota bacterium]
MTVGGIQFGGLASGLDTAAIIDAILAAEGRPLRVLANRKSAEQERLNLLGTFEGLVKKLRDKAHALQDSNSFFAHKLSLGAEGIASVTLSGSAEAGAHTLKVNSLAAADRYAFAGVLDPTADLTPGSLDFTYGGNSYSVTVSAGSDLNDLAAAINIAAGEDVTASVVNTGTDATPSYQLVLAGDDTGADFAIGGLLSTVPELGTAQHVSIATNAEVVIDGLTVQRSSNLFSDVLPGISFTVSRETVGVEELSFTVDVDPSGIRKNIQGFVDAYNEVLDFMNKQSSFSTTAGAGGPLFGDSTLNAIRSNLRRALFNPDETVMAANPAYGSLGLIGINLGSDGKLSIDETKLDAKLNGDLGAFEQFFNRADDITTTSVDERGAFVKLEGILDDLTKDRTGFDGKTKIEGLFHSRKTSIQRQLKGFDDDMERQQARLDKFEDSLVAKFAALEQLISGLQSQQAFLTANLANTNRR